MIKKSVEAYTDGSCFYKNRRGGFGVYMKYGKHEKLHSEIYYNTTVNRMELMAALWVLENIEIGYPITIHSDSQYVVLGINDGRLKRWIKTGEIRIKSNNDLWLKMDELIKKHGKKNITFKWVRGHNGNIGNEEADRLAGLWKSSDDKGIKDLDT